MIRKTITMSMILMFLICSCSTFDNTNQKIKSVSLMELIVNPKKYHGKLVRVIAVSRIEFEGNGLWLTKEHYKYRVYKNSLWLIPDYQALKSTRSQLAKYNGKYVLIEGIFNKDNRGHMGMNSGAIEKVTRFQFWEKGK